MIDREDIKEGLKFSLPNNKIRYKHQTKGFCDASEYFGPVQYFTVLKTSEGGKNYVTSKVPLFEVCDGPKLIRIADKKDPHCARVGEYIKVRSDAIGGKPFYMSLGDVMQRGRRAIDADLHPILSTENPKNNWAYPFASTKQPTGDADAFRDITNGMYDTFKAKNHDYGNSFSELFAECGMTYAYGHMAEKLKRVKSLMSDEAKVKGESMRDSLLDLANYAILTIMELDKARK